MTRPPFALLAVTALVAAGVAVGNGTVAAPGEVPRGGAVEPVVGALAVCPELLRAGGDVQTRLTVGTAQTGNLLVRAATVSPRSDEGPAVLAAGGEVGAFGFPGNADAAVAATATGALAGAMEAEQLSRGVDGIQRGLAGVRCESTAQESWFVGGSTEVGADPRLVLVNPYADAALVDVQVFGAPGMLFDDAFTVPPRSRPVPIKLANLAPDQKAIAVHVTTREGRVAAAVRDARVAGETPRGADWVPRAGRPAHTIDIGGVPAVNGARDLFLFAPGVEDATVHVLATFSDGTLPPAGLEEIAVAAGRVTRVPDFHTRLGNRSAALRLVSEGAPILAGLYVEQRARFNPIREFGWLSAAEPLVGPTPVTQVSLTAASNTLLVFSAPDGTARVRIRTLPVRGRPVRTPLDRVFTIPEKTILGVQLGALIREDGLQPVVVTPEPGSSTVIGTRAIMEQGQRGPLLTLVSLCTPPAGGVVVPAVESDPRVSLLTPQRRD